jgi:ERCC4-type nuclease
MDYTIIIDTREQLKIPFKNFEVATLQTGDYSIKGYENLISIERKSAIDLYGTLGKGNKRFKKELERSMDLEYFAIVVEDNFQNIRNKTFENSHFSKMKGYVITQILCTIHVKYNIPVFFTNNQYESKILIKDLFKAYLKNKSVVIQPKEES